MQPQVALLSDPGYRLDWSSGLIQVVPYGVGLAPQEHLIIRPAAEPPPPFVYLPGAGAEPEDPPPLPYMPLPDGWSTLIVPFDYHVSLLKQAKTFPTLIKAAESCAFIDSGQQLVARVAVGRALDLREVETAVRAMPENGMMAVVLESHG